ncbi:MAG: hypothetical protein KKB03_00120 [Nanoarchaeota archaeon]|nr:hypothetical protein [Nanoarchaeota archaeon]MBU1135505.1 hypothetical protein [Nanoarchaeota archaeon]MBU2519634.1 hypothetical protein [Nanoarchaeota archaeon]
MNITAELIIGKDLVTVFRKMFTLAPDFRSDDILAIIFNPKSVEFRNLFARYGFEFPPDFKPRLVGEVDGNLLEFKITIVYKKGDDNKTSDNASAFMKELKLKILSFVNSLEWEGVDSFLNIITEIEFTE